MARGFLTGALAGVVVAGLGAGGVSVALGPVFAPKPEVADGAGDDMRVDPVAPEAPAPETAPEGVVREVVSPQDASPGIPAPGSEAATAEGIGDTESTGLPEAGPAGELTRAPEVAEAAGVEAGSESPVFPNPQAVAPTAPEGEALSISNNPAQPPAPKPDVDESAPQMAATPEASDVGGRPEAEAPVGDQASPDDVVAAAEDAAPRPVVVEDIPETEAEENTAPKPRVTALLERDDAAEGPQVGRPAGTFGNLAPEVQTGRLPRLNTGAAAETSARPIEQFAETVEVAEGKPMMSIVLIDDGSTPLGLDALESFPYPITFAVDVSWTGAAEAMTTYREAGFEVMALTNLPAGALPQDAEVTLSTALSKVPEAVAVLEGDAGGLQESRDVSDQVADILAQTGHGLVMYPKGLNTAQTLARRAGVPAVTLFRDFDGKGQDARVIRRFLDQAAFKAGQEGGVIMLGRLRAETISALLIWGLQDRAERVALVPVTQVLLAGE